MENLTKEKVQDLINTQLSKYSEFGEDIHLYVSHTMERGFIIEGGILPYQGIAHLGTCYLYEFFKEINNKGMVVSVIEGREIISFEESLKEAISYIKKQLKSFNKSNRAEFGKNLYPVKYTK